MRKSSLRSPRYRCLVYQIRVLTVKREDDTVCCVAFVVLRCVILKKIEKCEDKFGE